MYNADADCPVFVLPDDPMDPMYNLLYGLSELVAKWPGYREAKRKYEGKIDEFSPNFKIQRALEKTSKLYPFNLASMPVKVMRNRLKVAGIKVDEGVQADFDAIWSANDMEVWLPKAIDSALKYGDAYMSAWTMPEEDDGTEDDDLVIAGIVVNLKHPMTTIVIYDEDDQRRAQYAIEYYKVGRRWRADVQYRDTIEHYITVSDNNRGCRAVDWAPYMPAYKVVRQDGAVQIDYADEVEENTFGEIPIKHARTDLPYGTPIHKDGYGPQNAISKLLVTQMSTVDAMGWPSRFALTDPQAVLDENHDAPDWEDDAASAPQDGTAPVNGQLRADPGYVQVLNGIKQLVQLEPGDQSNFTDPVRLYVSLMSAVTETPLYSFEPGGEQPSGKARQIADAPLEARKENIQGLLNGFLRDLVKFIMKINGTPTKTVEVSWKPSVLATDTEDWNVVAAKREEGVPFEVRMTEAGYGQEVIAEWLKSKEDMSIQEKIDLAAQIADMIKNLNVAVAGGIIDEKTANGVLKDVMTRLGFTIAPAPKKEEPVLMNGVQNGPDGVPVPGKLAGSGKPAGDPAVAGPGRPAGQGSLVTRPQGGGSARPGGGQVRR